MVRVEAVIAACAVGFGFSMLALPKVPHGEDPLRAALLVSMKARRPSNLQLDPLVTLSTPADAVAAVKAASSQQLLQQANSTAVAAEAHSFPHKYPDNQSVPILPKILAIYFPQYHSDPLNDRLWGKGFTDWNNLRDAPEFNRKGFRILRPTELGYYDLTDAEIRKKQGQLAAQNGIDGFVYHHYWFYDDAQPGPTLHAPLMKMLEDGYPDLPFALHWVAGKWTATWHRKTTNITTEKDTDRERNKEILQQQYLPKDPMDPRVTDHYRWLRQFFHHPLYLKDIDGKPIFMVYRHLDGMHPIIARFKELAKEDGFPGLHVPLGMYATNDELFPRGKGLGSNETLEGANAIYDRLTNYPFPYDWHRREKLQPPAWCLQHKPRGEPRSNNIVGIVSSFDNTPRREFGNARLWYTREGTRGVIKHFSKNLWSALYYHACCFAEGGANQFVIINAWNEWAEGMALEPSNVFERSFLNIIRTLVTEKFQSCF